MEYKKKPGFWSYALLAGFAAGAISLALYYNKEVNAGIEKVVERANEAKPECIKAIDRKIEGFFEERIKWLHPEE